jgi:hydroxymethylpyrimidine/phosphomethylpyrimidine kinase
MAPAAIDLFFDGRQFVELASRRIPGEGAHGTGCAFAAAIAAWLARGADLERAVREAKRFVSGALKRRYVLGQDRRPILGHLAGGLAPASAIRGRRPT